MISSSALNAMKRRGIAESAGDGPPGKKAPGMPSVGPVDVAWSTGFDGHQFECEALDVPGLRAGEHRRDEDEQCDSRVHVPYLRPELHQPSTDAHVRQAGFQIRKLHIFDCRGDQVHGLNRQGAAAGTDRGAAAFSEEPSHTGYGQHQMQKKNEPCEERRQVAVRATEVHSSHDPVTDGPRRERESQLIPQLKDRRAARDN